MLAQAKGVHPAHDCIAVHGAGAPELLSIQPLADGYLPGLSVVLLWKLEVTSLPDGDFLSCAPCIGLSGDLVIPHSVLHHGGPHFHLHQLCVQRSVPISVR